MKKTGIFIDYDNVFITLERYYEQYDCVKIQENFIFKLLDKYSEDKILTIDAYLDFNTVKISHETYSEYQKRLVQLRHVYSGNNSSDVTLIIDIIKSIYNEKNIFDKYVIVSSDSDMLPIINELRLHGKEVVVYYFSYNTNKKYEGYLKGANIDFVTLEEFLEIRPFKESDHEKFDEKAFIEKPLVMIHDLIVEMYNRYTNKTTTPPIFGTLSKGKLREGLSKNKAFVKEDIVTGFAIETLISKDIIYEFKIPNTNYKTLLINQEFLAEKNIEIENLLTEDDFKIPVTS